MLQCMIWDTTTHAEISAPYNNSTALKRTNISAQFGTQLLSNCFFFLNCFLFFEACIWVKTTKAYIWNVLGWVRKESTPRAAVMVPSRGASKLHGMSLVTPFSTTFRSGLAKNM